MSREDIAEYIYNDILELCNHDIIDFEDCENIAKWHETEIEKAKIELAKELLDLDNQEEELDCSKCSYVGSDGYCTKAKMNCIEGYLRKIISDNTEGE